MTCESSVLGGRGTEIFLHIGHPKTGTTYIQNTLALSVDKLEAQGIAYPITAKDLRHIRKNQAKINGGNATEIFRGDWPHPIAVPGIPKTVYSSEVVFLQLVHVRAARETLATLSEKTSVHVLLFVRDPIEFAISVYQQMVKRHGCTGSIEDYIVNHRYVDALSTCLCVLGAMPNLDVSIVNYSRERERVIEIVEDWIGVPEGYLRRPKFAVVNRGLTERELRIQLYLNKWFGPSGKLFADRICEMFPNRNAASITPATWALKKFEHKFGDKIRLINSQLPEQARLSFGS